MPDAPDSSLWHGLITESRDVMSREPMPQEVIARSRAACLEARIQREAARVVVEQVRAMIARSQTDGEADGHTSPERAP